MHGKTSPVHHDGSGVLAALPDPFTATRYHSLVVDPDSLPAVLTGTARTADGTLMACGTANTPPSACSSTPNRCSPPKVSS